MLEFILKFSACLSVFMMFYKLVLEHANMHQFKRFYLLGVVVVSAIIPFITFTEYVEPQFIMGAFLNPIDEAILFPVTEKIIETQIDYTPFILWSLYGLGALVFSMKFALNLKRIILKIRNNPKRKTSSFISVLLNDLITPHTFFSYIFLNKIKFENNQIPREVLLHEETHAIQKHSLDILFIEFFQIIFWFNPLVYFLKKDIKLNHEFLADQAVINHGTDIKNYQNLLLAFSSNAEKPSLAHAINYSLIKKRFTVMKTQTSNQSFWIRSFIILPILAILIYSFSTTKQVEKEVIPNLLDVRETPQEILSNEKVKNESGNSEELGKINLFKINYTDENEQQNNSTLSNSPSIDKDKYYKNATFKFRDKNKNIISIKTYSELSELDKRLLPPPPPIQTKKSPSKNQLTKWEDSKKYGIWLDSNRINNNDLKTLSSSEISLFHVSKLEKNAVNYGKHFYQVNLYSNSEFERINNESKKPLDSDAVIFIYKNEKLINSKNKVKTDYSVKATYSENKNTQQEAAPKEIAEYNKIVKKLMSQPESKRIIRQKDVERIKYIYNLMTDEQKRNAEPFPKLVPPPPPPAPKPVKIEVVEIPTPEPTPVEVIEVVEIPSPIPAPKPAKVIEVVEVPSPKLIEIVEVPAPPPPKMDIIYTYKNLAKRTKFIPNNRRNNMRRLKELYNKMSKLQKEKIENPNSIIKYLKKLDNLSATQIEKVNEAYNKIKANAQSKGRKFYTAREYKELENLYSNILLKNK